MYFPFSFFNNERVDLTRDLISFWTFNNCGDVGNDDFNGFDLTINGSIDCPAGKIGNCIENSSDPGAFVDVADSAGIFNLTSDKTFAHWVKSPSASVGCYTFGKYYNSPSANYLASINVSTAVLLVETSAGGFDVTSDKVPILDNIWYFICYKHYSRLKKISVQVNDTLPVYANYNGTVFDYNQNFNALEVVSQGTFMDSLGVWNRILNDNEIAALYNSGNGLEYPFTT